ncbi:Auxin efflux carrier component 2, partial [Mucuna pruriens]
MIKGKDVYEVVAALVPLYVAVFLAYGSVRWWKVFTAEQCSGINRFVAVFAVPFLSFKFIASNNPYAMNFKFLAGDSLQKVVILFLLFLWNSVTKWGSIDWTITLFSLSTLPNTLIMGVPLLKAMYGEFTGSLMVQIVVLQSVIWNTLLLFMFEYRGAKLLLREQFPDTARAIASLRVDSSVSSLSGREPLETETEIGENGELHVVVRSMSRSASIASSFQKGVEIYSVASSREQSERSSSMSRTNFHTRNAGFEEGRYWRSRSVGDGAFNNGVVSSFPKLPASKSGGAATNKGLHMFVWSSTASPNFDANIRHSLNAVASISEPVHFPRQTAPPTVWHFAYAAVDEVEIEEGITHPVMGSRKKEVSTEEGDANKKQEMPRATVIIKLILTMVWRNLIRNPNTYSWVLGLIWSLIFFRWNIKMPSIIEGSITIVSNTGLGMAMFSLGLFMALQPKIITCGKARAALAMAIKFLVGPAVIAATTTAIGIRGVLLHIQIVQAALPQGIIPFVFAKEYNLHADILSTAVIFGMVLALPVTIIYYVLLAL